MAVFTLDQARAELAHVGRDFREEDARAIEAQRRAMLLQIGDAIRAVDDVIAHIEEHHLTDQPGGQELLEEARKVRTQWYDRVREYTPEDAWFWTEEWQAGEREVDAQIAAGKGIRFESDEEFLAYLEALDEALDGDADPRG
jgi:hypothetical protein